MAKPEAQPDPASPKPAKGSGMMGKLMVGGVVILVVGIEAGAAYMLTPSPTEVSASVRQQLEAERNAQAEDEDLLPETANLPQVEVDIGQFNITIHQQASESSYSVTCKVIGTVAEKDQAEFDKLKALNEARLRERIMIEFRNAEVGELTDSELGLIKRRILEKTNALFGKPLLTSILLPDFNFYQQ